MSDKKAEVSMYDWYEPDYGDELRDEPCPRCGCEDTSFTITDARRMLCDETGQQGVIFAEEWSCPDCEYRWELPNGTV